MNNFKEDDFHSIRKNLESSNILNSKEIEDLLKLCRPKTILKGNYFIKENNVSNEIGFVLSGYFRSFYHSSEGDEITYCITFPNHFISAYSSHISNEKTLENIEAITDATLFVIPKEDILALEKSSINWLRFFKMVAEQQYIELENRIFLLQKEKAEIRYKNLIEKHPEFLQHIPLNYLASYLGVTQRHLSRIRKELSY